MLRRVDLYIDTKMRGQDNFKESADGPTDDQIKKASTELGLGETEYRLNWIPLGGYVKMLGQDDMNPNSQETDPRALTT